MFKLTYKQNRQVQQRIKLRIKYHLSLRHGTNSAVLKKRFHPHWNESVCANGLGGRSPRYKSNSVNMDSQTEFQTRHKCLKEIFQQKQRSKSIKVIHVFIVFN